MAYVKGKNPAGETLDYLDGITDGADVIVGNAGADKIYAGGGNDVLKGGGGADTLDGGSGRDTATYEDSTSGVEVSLVSGKGKGGTAEGDTLKNIEDLFGSKFDDKLQGNAQDNELNGGDGDDTLKGGGGADTLIGGSGNDFMEIDGTDDKAYGGDGIDTLAVKSDTGLKINLNTGFVDINTLQQATGTWYYHPSVESGYGPYYPPPGAPKDVTEVENVIGSSYNDLIYGNALANSLSGGNGDDMLSGLGGDDIISGGNGKDIIFGGLGADTLTGGDGADTFMFSSLDASVFTGGKPQDVITDFSPGDHIDLTKLSVEIGEFLALDNQSIDGANYTFVGVDQNGNGQFDEGEFAIAVKMSAGSSLTLGDFLF